METIIEEIKDIEKQIAEIEFKLEPEIEKLLSNKNKEIDYFKFNNLSVTLNKWTVNNYDELFRDISRKLINRYVTEPNEIILTIPIGEKEIIDYDYKPILKGLLEEYFFQDKSFCNKSDKDNSDICRMMEEQSKYIPLQYFTQAIYYQKHKHIIDEYIYETIINAAKRKELETAFQKYLFIR